MTPLRQQFVQSLRLKGFSERTVENYVGAIGAITRHYRRSPLELTRQEIRGLIEQSCERMEILVGTALI